MVGDLSGERRSFHRLCLFISFIISLIFVARYGWMLHTGVEGAVFAEDFEVFYKSALSFVAAPSFSPYIAQGQLPSYHPFLNPPFLLYFTWPLGFFSYPVALTLFISSQVGLWLAVLASAPVRRLWPMLAGQPGGYMLTCIAISLPFLINTVFSGQLGIFYAAIILLGTALLADHPWRSGFVLGLIACKPTFGLLIPLFLLAGGQRRALGGFMAMVLLLFISADFLWGIGIWTEWQHVLMRQIDIVKQPQLPEKFYSQLMSIYAALRMMGMNTQPALLVQALASLMVAYVLVVLTRKNASDARLLPFLYIGSFLATAYIFLYDAVLISAVLLHLLNLNGYKPLPLATRMGIILGLSFSLIALQLQIYLVPLGALTLLWLIISIYLEKPVF